MIGIYHVFVYSEYVRFNNNQYEFALIGYLQLGYIVIAHIGSHSMRLHPISDQMRFPIYFDGTSKNDNRDAMYVINNATCVTIVELQSISEHEREKSSLVW
jgi:hypothetical protein